MASYRKVFNETINYKAEYYQTTGKSISYFSYRRDLIGLLKVRCPYLFSTPPHILYGAMMDADVAYRGMVRKRVQGQPSELPRCRKHTQRSFYMLGNAITPDGIYVRKLGPLRTAESLPYHPSDSRIIRECGRWYVQIPYKVKAQPLSDNQTEICAIDPGVRTFATIVGSDGLHKVGYQQIGRVLRLAHWLDDLLSRASKVPSKKRRRMYEAASRLRRKIKRIVTDLHYTVIGWLCRKYGSIILPTSDFTDACRKAKRKIRSKSVRALMTWSFAKFRDRLAHKCKLYRRRLIVVNESYTSRTANWTGEVVYNLDGRKKITSWDITMDRDVNGALGILLKALVDHPSQEQSWDAIVNNYKALLA